MNVRVKHYTWEFPHKHSMCSQYQMNTCHTSFSYILWAYNQQISEREGEGERENGGQKDTENTEKQLVRQQKQAYNHLQLALLNSELVDHGPSLAVPMGQTKVDWLSNFSKRIAIISMKA